jgi:hypothetical protein
MSNHTRIHLPTWLPPLALLALLGGPAVAQKCEDAPGWRALIAAETVCGCTEQEAESLAAARVRADCAAAPVAIDCGGRNCDPAIHSRCETIVKEAKTGHCRPAPAGAVGCPQDCPGRPVQCSIPAQNLRCGCKCQPGRCNEAHWTVARRLSLGCVENTEEAKRSKVREAFLAECQATSDKVICKDRECANAAMVCQDAVHGTIAPTCKHDRNCKSGEVSCTVVGAVRCTCECH